VDPEQVRVCHCTDCQTLTGTAFRVVVPAKKGTFELRGAAPKTYVKTTADSGVPRLQGFCGECGTPLYSTSVGDQPDKPYALRVGVIRQRAELPPKLQQWCRSSLGWTQSLGSLEQVAMQTPRG